MICVLGPPPNLGLNKRHIEFDEWYRLSKKKFFENFISTLDYYSFSYYYASIFHKDNVGIFLYEELAQDKIRFSENLSTFLNISTEYTHNCLENKRYRQGGIDARMRKLHRCFDNIFFLDIAKRLLPNELKMFLKAKVLSSGKMEKTEVPLNIRHEIDDLFRESNHNLAYNWNLPLNEWQYPV